MKYKRICTENIIEEKLDDAYIISMGEKVHLLNETASVIFECCEGLNEEQLLKEVHQKLMKKGVEIDSETLKNDVKDCINQMIDIQILTIVS